MPTGSSRRAAGLRDSRTATAATAKPATPSGTLTQKTADQSKRSSRSPPTTGPLPNPMPAAAAQIPIAAVRCSPGYASTRIDKVSGAIIAAPVPWTARSATSAASSVASPQPADAIVKIVRPAM